MVTTFSPRALLAEEKPPGLKDLPLLVSREERQSECLAPLSGSSLTVVSPSCPLLVTLLVSVTKYQTRSS